MPSIESGASLSFPLFFSFWRGDGGVALAHGRVGSGFRGRASGRLRSKAGHGRGTSPYARARDRSRDCPRRVERRRSPAGLP